MTHGFDRPHSWMDSLAQSILTLGALLGSSGSPVISMTCHRFLDFVTARYSGPSSRVGFPAITILDSIPEPNAASAATMTASGMSPASSTRNNM